MYFSNTAAAPTTFGNILIQTVAYKTDGTSITGVSIFKELIGDAVTLFTNDEYLDTAGWHAPGSLMGTTQIVSAYDDDSLSATPSAIQGFLYGGQSTPGIVPPSSSST